MPPKSKAGPKQKDPEPETPPKTIAERTARIHAQGHPYTLSHPDRTLWANAHFARTPALLKRLPAKAQKEVWKSIHEAAGGTLPLRALPTSPTPAPWGRDRFGADLGEYSPAQFAARRERAVQLAALEVQSRAFADKRARERAAWACQSTHAAVADAPGEVDEERRRRRDIAGLRMALYGERSGAYGTDPEWDDVVPMPVEDGEGALAAIAYSEDYAEAISYLRAVMATKEYSHRCLRLTQHIISMNPAHYTVWLYRFSIVKALRIPLPDEFAWLNEVALDSLKNYQIWHHRRLLLDAYLPTLSPPSSSSSSADAAAARAAALAALAASEQAFLAQILAEDAKNYHVWSYRQYLLARLGAATAAAAGAAAAAGLAAAEAAAAAALIAADVRNNSAWAHRFFAVFVFVAGAPPADAAAAPPPPAVVEREAAFAAAQIARAPQSQSAWNYLRGVLAKGGRGVGSVEAVVRRYVSGLGGVGGGEEEQVASTHALEMLAEIHAERGEMEMADLALRRLGEKWDRIRLGYWQWRRQMLTDETVGA